MMKLKQYFLFCDIYARPQPSFTVKGHEKQSSYFGSVLTLIGLILCLSYFADLI